MHVLMNRTGWAGHHRGMKKGHILHSVVCKAVATVLLHNKASIDPHGSRPRKRVKWPAGRRQDSFQTPFVFPALGQVMVTLTRRLQTTVRIIEIWNFVRVFLFPLFVCLFPVPVYI